MNAAAAPTFDEWVDYCFTHGYDDFASSDESDNERWERFVNLDPQLLTGCVIRLFQEPEFVADDYTDDQIGRGVWFLFGIASEYFRTIRDDSVEPALQVKCFRSVESMYLRLFDRVCCKRGTDPEGDYYDREESYLDGAVYMIWDMDCIETAAMYPKKGAVLVEPCLDVLEAVLRRSRTSTCKLSALHGMGHLYLHFADYRKDLKNPLALRIRRAIDAFLRRQDVPDWLREYALQARDGIVQ